MISGSLNVIQRSVDLMILVKSVSQGNLYASRGEGERRFGGFLRRGKGDQELGGVFP